MWFDTVAKRVSDNTLINLMQSVRLLPDLSGCSHFVWSLEPVDTNQNKKSNAYLVINEIKKLLTNRLSDEVQNNARYLIAKRYYMSYTAGAGAKRLFYNLSDKKRGYSDANELLEALESDESDGRVASQFYEDAINDVRQTVPKTAVPFARS